MSCKFVLEIIIACWRAVLQLMVDACDEGARPSRAFKWTVAQGKTEHIQGDEPSYNVELSACLNLTSARRALRGKRIHTRMYVYEGNGARCEGNGARCEGYGASPDENSVQDVPVRLQNSRAERRVHIRRIDNDRPPLAG